MPLVLVVDDVKALAEQYAYDLNRVGGFDTLIATGGEPALECVMSEPVDCVILDLEMPGVDGFEVLRRLKREGVGIPVIVYTGTGSFERCVQAVKLGAYSFIDKAESMERVVREVENVLDRVQLEREIEMLKREVGAESTLIGSSQAMQELKNQIGRVAQVPSSVLIAGESGTGKELVARELHRVGFGEGKPFVAINSAALPENLIESELFGHERGAFTGANRTHKGAFEIATGGVLFLDEIGELPLSAQAKLLRVLEQGEITRVGGERTIKVNARVVAATNRNLEADVEAGRFRQDLYFRLNVHQLRVPPLRDRLSDVSELVKYFLTAICSQYGIKRKRIDPAVLESRMKYDWRRNNVRELRNIVERMIIAADDMIRMDHVPAEVREDAVAGDTGESKSLQALKAEAERQIIVAALERNDWHVTNTAGDLGLADHSSLLKIMRRHNLKRDPKN